MELTIQNVDALLNEQMQAYLSEKHSYQVLRSTCLNLAPISSVVSQLSIKLDKLAVDERALKAHEHTKEAHANQIHSDAIEEISDKAITLNCKREIEHLEKNIAQLTSQLRANNRTYMEQQVAQGDVSSQLATARWSVRQWEQLWEQQINSHQHGHNHNPNHQHVHSFSQRSRVTMLSNELAKARAQVTALEKEERRQHDIDVRHQTENNFIERERDDCKSKVEGLVRQLDELKIKQRARDKRCSARILHQNELHRNALSLTSARSLDIIINNVVSSIKRTCAQMKNEVEKQCYDVFLKQLEIHVDTLALNENERTTLKEIIEAMKKHQSDMAFKREQESILASLQSSLQSREQGLSNKQAQFISLIQRNKCLTNDNEILGAKLLTLQTSHEKLLEDRNRFATFSLAAIGVTAISAITAYFLIQASVLALVPGVNLILGAAAGLAIMGLTVTCGVAAIRASYKQADILVCKKNLNDNTAEFNRNNLTMNQSEKTDIPNLKLVIENLKKDIEIQVEEAKIAGVKAAASIEHARKIELVPYNSYARFYSGINIAVACEDDVTSELPIAKVCYPSAPPL